MLLQSQYRLPKLLIVYASYGEGHIQAAKALRDACEEYGQMQVIMCDLMAESHPWLNEMTRRFYQKSYTHLPYLYGWMYGITKPMKHNSLFGSWLHSFGRHKVRQLLHQEKPDAVLYTFPFYAHQGLKNHSSRIPSYSVITDFDLHCRWVHPSIDRYYVATPDLSRELRQRGIHPQSIKVSGIPLKKGFQAATPSPELYAKYGMQPGKPTVLMMAGAQGVLPHVLEMCDSMLHLAPELQIALVCGHNSGLHSAAIEQFRQHPAADRLHTFGYMNEIHELMALSDCLVTKPGGVTLSEAIAAELPAFIYRPVPGQEKQNALYLQSKGAAIVSNDLDSLIDQMLELVHDPMRLMNMRFHIRKLQPKDNSQSISAAQTIVLDIVSNLRIINHASLF